MEHIEHLLVDGRRVTLNELLDMLDNTEGDDIPESGVDVALLPPTNATDDVTDEDSGDEDAPCIENVPGSQLNASVVSLTNVTAPSQLLPTPRGSTEFTEDHQNHSSTPSLPSVDHKRPRIVETCTQPKSRKRPRIVETSTQSESCNTSTGTPHTSDWKKQQLNIPLTNWPSLCTVKYKERTPKEYFELFFDEDCIDLMTTYTNQYAAKRNRLGDCSQEEMKCFIAILLLSGYVDVPRKDMYWETSLDAHNVLVSKAMARDRFRFIMWNLHVCNNDELAQDDRFAKVRPLLKCINEKCKEFSPHIENHSVDESMVPYFGKHGAKQFIHGKPIRYGFKFWCGGPSSGYITWFEPYQGGGTLPEKYTNKGLGYGVVMTYVDQLEELPYRLYFDNFFTSIPLLTDLTKRNIRATGTIRANRIGKDCDIMPCDEMKKKPRGTFDFKSNESSKVLVTRWNDNSVVSVATNFDNVFPNRHVSRYSRKEKKRITIDQPQVIHNYNTHMGGIDRADENISLYRVSIRGKKWYFPIIVHCIDVAEQNAWQLYRHDGGKLDHLAFRRRIVTAILESNQRVVSSRGRPGSTSQIDTRYDKIEHYVADLPSHCVTGKKKQLKCRLCHKKCTTLCVKCTVTLHVSCFIPYHTK